MPEEITESAKAVQLGCRFTKDLKISTAPSGLDSISGNNPGWRASRLPWAIELSAFSALKTAASVRPD
jgi:hypothetical protein